MRRLALILFLLVVLSLAGTLVLAQSGELAIPWFATSGGGSSQGGTFALSGTAGQPAAGEMSGGAFAIDGGHWSGFPATTTDDDHQIFLPVIVRPADTTSMIDTLEREG